MKRNYIILFLLGALLAVAATLSVNPAQQQVDEVTELWSTSGHADYDSISFTEWDEDGEIPPSCAKCHSTTGFHNFLGLDGSTALQIDEPVETGTVVMCSACHNTAVNEMATVPYPGGFEIQPVRNEASCLNCHQGRATGLEVEEAIAGLELDEQNDELSFISVHYLIAALAKMGSEAHGAYQYEGQNYQGYYEHVQEFETCETCHDPHAAEINADNCSLCHFNVADYGDLRLIREGDTDWAGDGIVAGVDADIQTMHARLYELITDYSANIVGEPIVYNFDQFPYWFQGTEEDPGDPYESWTPRLLRTAYNYHFVMNAQGAFAHNPRYTLQVLYDSIADFSEVLDVDMTGMTRAPDIVDSSWRR